jgi:hypothetical protein
MSDLAPAPAGVGHNLPKPMSALEVTAFLADTMRPMTSRRDELLAGVTRFLKAHPEIDNDEDQGKSGDFVKQLGAAIRIAHDVREEQKKPFLAGGRAVDAFFKAGIVDPLDVGMKQVQAVRERYALRVEAEERRKRQEAAAAAAAESARIQREIAEQERLQREAAARSRPVMTPPPTIEEAISAAEIAQQAEKAALAKSADLSRNRGEGGSVSSLREQWYAELEDITKVPLEYLMFNQAKADRAVQRPSGVREIPGVRIYMQRHLQTR